jgi:hypothetical protein
MMMNNTAAWTLGFVFILALGCQYWYFLGPPSTPGEIQRVLKWAGLGGVTLVGLWLWVALLSAERPVQVTY